MKLLKAIATLALCWSLHGGDCVPNTFSSLSYIISRPTESDQWMGMCFDAKDTEHRQGPTIEQSIQIWNKMHPRVQMVQVDPDEQLNIDIDVPYIWFGQLEPEMKGSNDGAHCALAYFHANYVEIITTVYVKDIQGHTVFDIFVEHITYKRFYERTLVIYELKSKDIVRYIRWTALISR